jgi:formamidopyrimidine-DNA glycosylase
MNAALRFASGQLALVETSTRKRAAIYLVRGHEGLEEHRRGGLDVLTASFEVFKLRLTAENHTVKRTLTSPSVFDGIGNAYSDEILFRAKLSPVRQSKTLSDEEVERLRLAAKETLEDWTERLKTMYPQFPKPSDITAFRQDFAVHGRYGQPCPVCGAKIQRIAYADNETNYCARCQNEGRLLADRSLSRLLKNDWPKMLED